MQEKQTLPAKHNALAPVAAFLARVSRRDRTDTVLKVVFLSLQLADLTLTLVAAHSGYPELNPFMRASLGSFYMLVVVKFLIPLAISWFVPGRLLLPAIALLGVVVGWNVKELISLAVI